VSLNEFMAIAAGLLSATFVGLWIARRLRERRDEAYSDPAGAWTLRSQLPIDLGPPYNQFGELYLAFVHDIREGRDEGFDVAYFQIRDTHRVVHPCAIVQLPVEGPTLSMTEGSPVPAGVGPQAAELLARLSGLSVQCAPFALFMQSLTVSGDTVERTALALAKAIVADTQSAAGAAGRRALAAPRAGRIFG
jgi:hypothetical protein